MDSACPHPAAPGATASGAADTTREGSRRRAWMRVLLLAVALVTLAAAWRFTPLRDAVRPERLREWMGPHRTAWYAPLVTVAVFVVGTQVMVPVLALILAAGIVFGPWLGSAYAVAGTLASAAASFAVGRRLGAPAVRRLTGPRFDRVNRRLARHGVLAAFLIRKLPVAPFGVVNVIAGASGLRFRDFMIGTFLGMAPGAVLLAVFGARALEALRDPSPATLGVLALVFLLLVGIAVLVQRLMGRPDGGEDA